MSTQEKPVEVTLEYIVPFLEDCGYDDDNYGRNKVAKWTCEYGKAQECKINTDSLAPSEEEIITVKALIIQELNTLINIIEKHESDECLILPEVFDYKFGHWSLVLWIIGRHWVAQNRFKEALLPRWYLEITNILSTPSSNGLPRCCKVIVVRILKFLDKDYKETNPMEQISFEEDEHDAEF